MRCNVLRLIVCLAVLTVMYSVIPNALAPTNPSEAEALVWIGRTLNNSLAGFMCMFVTYLYIWRRS